MRKIEFTFLLLLAALVAPLVGQAAQPRGGEGGGGHAVGVRAILFVASKQPGPTDPKLAEYEANIRANLRFESFRYVGEGRATVAPGEKKTISLPQGNRAEVSNEGGTIRVGPGVSPPAVLMGGSAGKGDVYGIIVVTQ
jgi:hypothetical protein